MHPLMRVGALSWLAVVPVQLPAAEYPQFDVEPLKHGRVVWIGTCKDCHANPDSDAPQVTDRNAWTPRVGKGLPTLYRSALGGFKGPSGTEMPARGGNRSLSDDDVKAAVEYMVKIVSQPQGAK